MTESTGKVYIVEDDTSVRDMLRTLVESEGFEAQTYDSAEDLLSGFDAGKAADYGACMLLDVRLPGVSGMSLLEQLSRRDPALPVILISAHTDVPLAVKAMKSGALDVIEKPFKGEAVLKRVRDAMTLHRSRHREHRHAESLQQRYGDLSRRERQVMRLVVRGLLNKQIAMELGLSTKTVECHRARVMEKMAAESLADLVRMAVTLEEKGVIEHQDSDNPLTTNGTA